MLAITPQELDADCYLLCTPEATYDLRLGMAGGREHRPGDFMTKVTSVSPGDKGADLWEKQLDLLFCGDRELMDYVQLVAGTACIGKVFIEQMIIAYGCGANGKSTFWNTLARVLGTYSGMVIERKHTADLIPADYNPRKDLKPGDAEYEKLKRSIEQFGYVEPVIWNKTTGFVVGGHQRLKVLLDMGITEVPGAAPAHRTVGAECADGCSV